MRKGILPILALAGLLLLPSLAMAHKVSVFAYLEDGQVRGEGYFSSGDKAMDSSIELYDPQGKKVAQGTTDKKGEFSVPLPPGVKGPLKVVINASMGHRGEYTLSAADLEQNGGTAPAAAAASAEAPAPSPQAAAKPSPAPAAAANPAPAAPAGGPAPAPPLDDARLEAMLNKLLDQKLNPLNMAITKMSSDRGESIQEIVGGIGYIVGLMGLVAYMKSRKG